MSAIVQHDLVLLLHYQIVKYCRLAPAALWLFEYCLTFDDELRFVWGRCRWNFVHVLFIITRYLPAAALICVNYDALAPRMEMQTCLNLNRAGDLMPTISTMATDVVLFMRTFHLLVGRQKMRVTLITFYVSTSLAVIGCTVTVVCMGYTGICASELSASQSVRRDQLTAGIYAGIALFELVVVAMTIFQGCASLDADAHSGPRLVATLRQGNLVYAWPLLVMSSGNVAFYCFPATLKEGWLGLFFAFQFVLHGVMGSRILFRLRSVANRGGIYPTLDPISPMEFASIPQSTLSRLPA
ncbi:hypothetical protein BV22DRAFT_260458 [Leucogyrophana mollusca]|uniref:Uncharacterized protein n=1 Tax=Leucogyrophana mollusca TaxID=85980 RepID=A0ACB8BNZ1_9AGAM|nr:hypothetical protein BV22DRAFT_260458 [Leucogyrophana mollusca]